MLHTGDLSLNRRRHGRALRAPRPLATLGAIAIAAAALAGCAAPPPSGPAIQVEASYVPVPQSGDTVAFLVIRNNGGSDSLVSATTSVGGRVTFHAPDPPGVITRRTVPDIPIPAHGVLSMVPDGFYLVISGVTGPMRGGNDISLTLDFAHTAPVTVQAQVTNPSTGGASYFLN